MRVEQFYVKNQFIIYQDDYDLISFQSYNSLCCNYNTIERVLVIFKDFNYSSTTSKYFNKFIREYVGNELNYLDIIKQIKKMYDKKIKYSTIGNLKIYFYNMED